MVLFTIFIFSIIIFCYNIKHKEIEIVVLNIILLLIFIIIKLIVYTLGIEAYYLAVKISELFIIVAIIILVIQKITKYIKNKQLCKNETFGIALLIILFVIYSQVMSISYSVPAGVDSDEYVRSTIQVNLIIRMLCELPMINTYIMTMFEDKKKKGA